MTNKRLPILTLLLVSALLFSACAQPTAIAPEDLPAAAGEAAAAVSEADAPAAGEAVRGGVWTEAELSDASILNPILGADNASSGVYDLLFPRLIATDPFTGEIVADYGALAESWDVSDDGLIWTFNLRDGVFWSDGEQVTAEDFKYTYDAIGSDLVETVRKSFLAGIESIEVLDPLTIQVTYDKVQCDGLNNLGLGWLPSHLYAEDFSDIMTSPLNEEPAVSAGPFVFQSWARDDNTILVRNEDYWEGAPNMDGKIFRIVPDPGARLAQLQSGEVDVTGIQPEQIATVDGDPSLKRFNARDDGYIYVGLNLADPENPAARPG